MASLIEIREERLRKIGQLRALGIDPYPARSSRTHASSDVLKDFAGLEDKELTLAGRLMSWREHGQIIFADLEDESGRIQLYIKDGVMAGFDKLNLFDIGDFVQASGRVTKTKNGTISLEPKELRMLSKSLRPLPDKHEGLKDPELIFRQRYLDLATNPDRREFFKRKSKFWEVNR